MGPVAQQLHSDAVLLEVDQRLLGRLARATLENGGVLRQQLQAHLEELYNVEVSPELISKATDAVYDEVQAWRSRPLDPIWPIVFLDAIVLKIRDR